MARALADDDIMPNGKYKGIKMKDVPDNYLLWGYKNDRLVPEVRRYVRDNFNLLTEKRNETR